MGEDECTWEGTDHVPVSDGAHHILYFMTIRLRLWLCSFLRLADLMEEHKEELATLESIDSGAVYTLALKTHIGFSIDCFRYFAGWCDKIHVSDMHSLFLFSYLYKENDFWVQGQTIPINNARPRKNLSFTRKEPIGSV